MLNDTWSFLYPNNKICHVWARPWAILLSSRGTKENLKSLNLCACTKDPEMMLEILDGGVVEPRRKWKTISESPSKIAVLIPIFQANHIITPIPTSLRFSKITPSTLTLYHGGWGRDHLTEDTGCVGLTLKLTTWNSSK